GTEEQLRPDFFRQSVAAGESLLLCSDGLSNVVSDQEMLYEVIHGGAAEECCQRLLDSALARGAPGKGTCVLVHLEQGRGESVERVGAGGMAVVYKGRDHRLNRLVAIKILKEDLAQDADIVRRFHDESQAVAMLSHPNIMAVYDVSRWENVDYIVMELLDGI